MHLRDAREVTVDTFGRFDAVASLGAFEHFCSVEDYHAGRQDHIYASLFENVAAMLPAGGRLYLQTMVFGPRMIPIDEVSLDAPRDSDAWYLALMQKQFPGSFLPFGQEQVIAAAAPSLRLVSSISGRLDYIETIRQWRQRFAQPSMSKRLMKLQLVPRFLASSDFRLAFTSGVSSNSVCFERELLEHYRLVFEKPRYAVFAASAASYSAARVMGRPRRSNSVGSANREIRERWVRVHASTTSAKGW